MNRLKQIVINNKVLQLPCFFPSISTVVKTNYIFTDYLEILSKYNPGQFLISAYDIYNADKDIQEEILKLLFESKTDFVVLLDSGNYESYWKQDTTWDQNKFHNIIGKHCYDLAFTYDDQNIEYRSLEEFSNKIVTSFNDDKGKVLNDCLIPIFHAKKEDINAIAINIANRIESKMIAIPERELGQGILERAINLALLRQSLNNLGKYLPIHLLGADNPYAVLIYSYCGADSFDGLIWKQTAVDHTTGLLHHFHLREIFDYQLDEDYSTYSLKTLIHNLEFNAKWFQAIQQHIEEGKLECLLEKYLPKKFLQEFFKRTNEILC